MSELLLHPAIDESFPSREFSGVGLGEGVDAQF